MTMAIPYLTICSYSGEKFSADNSEFIYVESWRQINILLRENNASFDLSRILESKQFFDTPFEYVVFPFFSANQK
jgi:hypothetical protein